MLSSISLMLALGELALVDQFSDMGIEGMDTFIGLLMQIWEELFSKVPEMVFRLHGVAMASNTYLGSFGAPLLWSHSLGGSGGSACLCPQTSSWDVSSWFWTQWVHQCQFNVEGFKVVKGSHVECLPVHRLMGRCEAELRGLPAVGGIVVGCHCNFVWEIGTCLGHLGRVCGFSCR